MIPPRARQRFTAVLKAEQLDSIQKRFHDPAFCDEVPLYSRYAQVGFLKQFGDVDRLLLELSLEYLRGVQTDRTGHKEKRFIAVTIIRDDVKEYIVPYIFICNDNPELRLKGLQLSPPAKGLGKYIQALLQAVGNLADYSVLEDRRAVPDDVKVFVGYKRPPEGLICLEAFANSVNSQ